jgi:hypothetical protein
VNSSTTQSTSGTVAREETVVDRFTRLAGILKHCAGVSETSAGSLVVTELTFDFPRAHKVLDKLLDTVRILFLYCITYSLFIYMYNKNVF